MYIDSESYAGFGKFGVSEEHSSDIRLVSAAIALLASAMLLGAG